MASNQNSYAIRSKTVATKFGSVLAAADMNKDSFDDLLIGEPLYTEEDCVDCGALNVYLGGDLVRFVEIVTEVSFLWFP